MVATIFMPLVWPETRLSSAGSRRAVGVGIGVVAHREMLRVLPHRGDGVAVEIAHHLAFGAESAGAARRAPAGIFGEQIGLAAVIGLLLGGIGVVLVGGVGLGAVEAERLGGVGCRSPCW